MHLEKRLCAFAALSSLLITIFVGDSSRIPVVQASFIGSNHFFQSNRITNSAFNWKKNHDSSPATTTSVLSDISSEGVRRCSTTSRRRTGIRLYESISKENNKQVANSSDNDPLYRHVLVILSMPETSMSRIANEAILNTALQYTSKISIVLRCESLVTPSLASLRKYVGEVYSQLWDYVMNKGEPEDFANVAVYPNNLPNVAPEQWIHHLPDLDCVCSHDSICGWMTQSAQGRGKLFQSEEGNGFGGLNQHVDAINRDREQRNLQPVKALHPINWPEGAYADFSKRNVIFIDDDIQSPSITKDDNGDGYDDDDTRRNLFTFDEDKSDVIESNVESLLGGAKIGEEDSLFRNVAVGGTFDGMHYGHRKLLTLAISSVSPLTGKLFIGVTRDEMLQSKEYSEFIPPLKERIQGVRTFVHQIAPGMKNRVKIIPISDAFGPPGDSHDGKKFDALVLSDETLGTGYALNKHREETLGFPPLALLCTRRTEPNGMSSTAIRRLRSQKKSKSAV